jgi:predicted RNA binding protein YcfA (HicA-like mRNA interferase family)
MKYSELYRMLEKNGWVLKRTNKHRVYVNPKFEKPLIVPNHPGTEVPKGTLGSIKKGAGL